LFLFVFFIKFLFIFIFLFRVKSRIVSILINCFLKYLSSIIRVLVLELFFIRIIFILFLIMFVFRKSLYNLMFTIYYKRNFSKNSINININILIILVLIVFIIAKNNKFYLKIVSK